jgi:hypothetical protein
MDIEELHAFFEPVWQFVGGSFREAVDDDHIIGKCQRAQLRKSARDRDHSHVDHRQALFTPPVPLSETP